MGKRKFYVVWNGLRPGIYDSWAEAKLQINEYPNARYKSFNSEEEAINAYSMGYEKYKKKAPIDSSKEKRMCNRKVNRMFIKETLNKQGSKWLKNTSGQFLADFLLT